MGTFIIGPKIPVIDEQADGSTYGNNMRQFLRMVQALVQANVINLTTANPPANPNNGDTYIVAAGATGVWVGQENNIAYWTLDNPNAAGGEWDLWPPIKGWLVTNQADGSIYQFNGTAWVKLSTGSGGGVSGKWPGNWIGSNAAGVSGFVFNQGANIGMDVEGFAAGALGVSRGPSATEPAFVPLQTSALSESGGIIDLVFNISLGLLSDWFAKVSFVGLTDSRYWVGFSDQSNSTASAVFFSSTPAANFVGFRLATDIESTIKAVCQTGSSNQTIVDTGVVPTPGTPQVLEIVPTVNGTTVTFYINGVLVATIDTNVPSNSLGLATILAGDFENNVSSDEQLNFFYVYALLKA